MRSLSGLNPEQKRAVEIVDRHLLVVAGAGSGKTRVLTHKIVHLIEDHSVSPGSILAMTFSNRAAREMQDRVRILLPSFEQPRWVGTFHSMCLRLLKDFAREAGLPTNFSIYDESDQLSAIKRALKDLNLDPKHFPPSSIRYHIDRAKNETDQILKHLTAGGVLAEGALKVVERYEQLLKQNNALDFGDLLTHTVRLIRTNDQVRETLHKRFKRLLIDEYQDTNRIQKELVHALAGSAGIVCAVGDEDQSIYGWRGARVENIMEFDTDFGGAEIVKLEQNYRSTKQILTVANSVISHNKGRRGKNLWTENGDGTAVAFFQAEDDHAEAEFTLDRILEIIRAENMSAKQVAIFYRTHVQSRLLEEECRRRNIAYRIFGGVKFYDRAEVKDVLAFLRLALNPADNISFQRIINSPARGIGDKSIENLAALAAQRNCSMFDAIPFVEGKAKAEKALMEFHTWFTPMVLGAGEANPSEATESILDQSGYIKALENENTIESEARVENIQELLRSMEEFMENEEGNLASYMDRISLISDVDSYNDSNDLLTMMTVHNSKGLEFDVVFVVGMEEGLFPHQRSIEDGDENEVEEERRLCYVAMTRARKQLVLTAAARRRVYQSTQFNPVSRFIGEIPAQHLVDESKAREEARDVQISTYSQWGKMKKTVRQAFDEFKQESYDEDDASHRAVWAKAALKAQANAPYPPGSKVMHPDFGVGTVQKCEGKADQLKLTIQFQRFGVKKLNLKYCTLELVDR